jgi:hypothetical protein
LLRATAEKRSAAGGVKLGNAHIRRFAVSEA